MANTWSFVNNPVDAGQVADPTTEARALPLDQTQFHTFRDAHHAAKPLALKELGNIDTMNPIQAAQDQAALPSSPANSSSTTRPGHPRIAITVIERSNSGLRRQLDRQPHQI